MTDTDTPKTEPARARALLSTADMKLLRLHARQFRTLLDEMPKASERVMELLTARLQRNR